MKGIRGTELLLEHARVGPQIPFRAAALSYQSTLQGTMTVLSDDGYARLLVRRTMYLWVSGSPHILMKIRLR